VRGLGSVYYLAYGASAAAFPAIERLWPIVVLTVVLSVVVHGVTSTHAMRLVDRAARRRLGRRTTRRSGRQGYGDTPNTALAEEPPA